MPTYRPASPGVTSRMRLRGHDYSEPGHYFVTICISDRTHRLGSVSNDCFTPNTAGTMVEDFWVTIPFRYPAVDLDAWCLMPNHLHGIIGIGVHDDAGPPFTALPQIMNWFKSVTTVEYIRGVRNLDWPRFDKRLWQDGYHEHIVRDEQDLTRIRSYIEGNPSRWPQDEYFR